MRGIYLFDRDLNLTHSISETVENVQELELGKLIKGRSSFVYKKEYGDAFYFAQKDENFWLYKIVGRKKARNLLEQEGVHILYDDLKGCIIRDIRLRDLTASQALVRILDGTGWQVGISQATGTASKSFYYTSALTAFFEAKNVWNFEYMPRIEFSKGKIVGKYIDIYDRLSKDHGKWFEYGDKLLDVVAEESSKDLYTAFIGRGKGEETGSGGYGRKITFKDIAWSKESGFPIDKPAGLDYVEIVEATRAFGYPDGRPKIGLVNFDDIEDKFELLQATYDHAVENCRPKVQLKSSALCNEQMELGEVCTIIRRDMGIKYKTRAFKVIKDFNIQKVIQFEIGDKIIVSTADREIQNQKKQKQDKEEIQSKLEQALEGITNSYFNEDGFNYELKIGNEYNLPAGYYSFDKPIDENPTSVIYVGAGKMLIADEKDTQGKWKWKTAATAKGIVGNTIIANSITVNQLASDVGQSLDLSSNESITQRVEGYIEENKVKLKGEDGKDGADGLPGAPGKPGKDGVGLAKTEVKYGISQSFSTQPTTWGDDVPPAKPGEYIWTKTTWTYTNNTSESSFSVSRIGKDGNSGTDGKPGKDGVGLVSTTITYAKNKSGTEKPTTWTTSIPATKPGDYIWMKTTWTYTDRTNETGYSVGKIGDTGQRGQAGEDGVGIESTVIAYAVSDDGITPPQTETAWKSTIPKANPGEYLWTKTIWTYTNGEEVVSYSVSKMGSDAEAVKIRTEYENYIQSTMDMTKEIRSRTEYEEKDVNGAIRKIPISEKLSEVIKTAEEISTKVEDVDKGLISKINQQANQTVFTYKYVNGEQIHMLRVTPESAYIKDATIKAAHIDVLDLVTLLMDGRHSSLLQTGDGIQITRNDGTKSAHFYDSGIQLYDNNGSSMGKMGYYRNLNKIPGYQPRDFIGVIPTVNSDATLFYGDGSTNSVGLRVDSHDGSTHVFKDLYMHDQTIKFNDATSIEAARDYRGVPSGFSILGAREFKITNFEELYLDNVNQYTPHRRASIGLTTLSKNGKNYGQIQLKTQGSTWMEISGWNISMYRTLNMNDFQIIGQSDRRLKKNIQPWKESGIEETKKIEMATFEWINEKSPKGKQYGIIAQSTPFLSISGQLEEDYLATNATLQMHLNTKTNQELIEWCERLEERIGALENGKIIGL